MKTKRIPTPTVSQILREEFLDPLEITPYRLAKELHVSTSTILEILHNKRKVTVDMSLRLAKFFGMSDKFWINLQNDLEIRKQKEKLKLKLDSIQTLPRTG
ncbi:HigA family addiction module antitoxin [Leptospira mayottensis]|uniref:Addiction module antidote protein, HigA family n=1 Tax=Leptospira mayottensis TaxID=1137606 RepID=A0ABN5NWY5_9LEPT|nr:HigA family addiction module antitoxin [Leptospira mayottensis]AXR62662.1 addiction module antidote protein, HigA family [Leptospira mayottensis]AXR66443.1 addiction module antidote protein, HigA family [Leptospira mayottensis]AXR69995.1 addiction module antidote protein, HigA family [Leptospira mayottensis]AZQ04045.1 addiction module antidote protein, HigA family [Leptospira mayottensis 200901116]TGM95152.1 addiction module antidote protein, HigA family [Leptospira mayottensis]